MSRIPCKEVSMMEAHLGITTCDKCGKLMEKGQPVLAIVEGIILEENEMLTFQGSCVRHACHLTCWDGIEEGEETNG
jgi:hypothetical protein